MKKLIVLPLLVTILWAFAACNNNVTENRENSRADSASVNKSLAKEIYTCPMDTDVHSDKPGKCPKCGMDLEKQTK